MFPRRYFPKRYMTGAYFPPTDTAPVPDTGSRGRRLFPGETRPNVVIRRRRPDDNDVFTILL